MLDKNVIKTVAAVKKFSKKMFSSYDIRAKR